LVGKEYLTRRFSQTAAESDSLRLPKPQHMKYLAIIALCLFTSSAFGQTLSEKDLKGLEGETWIGTLTYLDYGSGKKTSIKSNLNVAKKSKEVWTFAYTYPDEPNANSTSEIMLEADGKKLNGQNVIAKRGSEDGTLQIVTTKEGQDNDKQALFRFTYTITQKALSIRKEVQYVGGSEWFERNVYSWTR
jgi:uncharacterized protein YdbL (DUF1318 family)